MGNNSEFKVTGVLDKPLAKLIMVNIPAHNVEEGRDFYNALFGTPFARSLHEEESYHAPVSAGVKVDISRPHVDGQPVAATLAVQNLEDSLKSISKHGGKVLESHLSLDIQEHFRAALTPNWKAIYNAAPGKSMGKSACIMDPFGNILYLVELEKWAEKAFEDGHLNLIAQGYIHGSAMRLSNSLF